LHQQVQKVEGMMDHRERKSVPFAEQYAPTHSVRLVADSLFAKWAGANDVMVNSLHGQGVNRLAQGLRALAYAPDGLIEAFEVVGASTFAYAVQWHPEWRPSDNVFYAAMFAAFGDACRMRHSKRIQ
jgi:putative glutamine amidotransferase